MTTEENVASDSVAEDDPIRPSEERLAEAEGGWKDGSRRGSTGPKRGRKTRKTWLEGLEGLGRTMGAKKPSRI